MTSGKDCSPLPRRHSVRLVLTTILVTAGVIAIAFTALGRTPWSGASSLDAYTIAYSAHEGEALLVLRTELNEDTRIPGGGIACCWEEAGSLIAISDQPMPSSVQVTWSDEDTGSIYRAETELPDDLTAKAAKLPGYEHEIFGQEAGHPYLIIGLDTEGKMVIWLSNRRSAIHTEGRILDVVAEAQGERIEEHEVHP
ncbi:DUF2931 family protein [Aquisalimonas asiatica]|uniref:DUF2931 family protein n=1 Tax=Aquisalimonas asiatica TaxID=406100 RepID=A0A1H8TAM7_9GAMM|nr:DUF2931 family protein [Aquisalimonas asiatica]SEO87987.1 Protein of unknown function [Aquisalimonas asiatica]